MKTTSNVPSDCTSVVASGCPPALIVTVGHEGVGQKPDPTAVTSEPADAGVGMIRNVSAATETLAAPTTSASAARTATRMTRTEADGTALRRRRPGTGFVI